MPTATLPTPTRRRNPRGQPLTPEARSLLVDLTQTQHRINEGARMVAEGTEARRLLLWDLYHNRGISQTDLAEWLSAAGEPIGPDLVQKALRAVRETAYNG